MAITPLPPATIHLLGSAQVLTTPISLVKELIDNALDAKATSIDILVSQNTLDKIEVRDNGHGIPTEDLDSLGRRGHTSKMRSFEELKFLGGVSLGFRGEALASAVQLAEVTVTTKTDGEPVATSVTLKAPGGVDQQTRTSHPVGTTVSVTKFFEKIPVRKQTALKQAPKALVKIKELLQAYALARPFVRFTLKVAKGNKGSWSFAPRNNSIREAVSLVIGRDAAMQCLEKSMGFPQLQHAEDFEEDAAEEHEVESGGLQDTNAGRFLVHAFLPKPDADPSKVDQGQYMSVDSRPVSHEKGTMRKIVTIFKFYFKGVLSDSSEKIKTPFLRLDIKCPVASYDPNVEPAKDDVIFGNESIVLESLEKLFKDVYGAPRTSRCEPSQHQITKELDDFESRLIRKSAPPTSVDSLLIQMSPPVTEQSPGDPASLLSTNHLLANEENRAKTTEEIDDRPEGRNQRKWEFDMSNDYAEEVEDAQGRTRHTRFRIPAPSPSSDEDTQSNPKNPLNPWIIAKMTTPVQQRSGQNHMPSSCDIDAVLQPCLAFHPTPQHSSGSLLLNPDTFISPATPSRPMQTFRSEDIQSLQLAVLTSAHQRLAITNSNAASLRISRPSLPTDLDNDIPTVDNELPRYLRRNDFVVARDVLDAPSMPPPVTKHQKGARRARDVNRPFVSPLRTAEITDGHDDLHQAKLPAAYYPSHAQSGNHQPQAQNEANTDLAWAMNFEQRKEDATRQRREEIRAAQMAAEQSQIAEMSGSSPHKNRYNAAIAALKASPSSSSNKHLGREKELFKTSLPDCDPRAYLMRRQKFISSLTSKSGESPRRMRAKSAKLPLERIPVEETVHNLRLTIQTNVSSLREIAATLAKIDMYVCRGSLSPGLVMESSDTPTVTKRLQEAVHRWKKTDAGKIYEVEYNLRNLLNIK